MTTAFIIESEPFGDDFRLALVVPDESKASGVGIVLGVETGGEAQTWTVRLTGDMPISSSTATAGWYWMCRDCARMTALKSFSRVKRETRVSWTEHDVPASITK